MARGTVKWFDDKKGFGFLAVDGGGEDAFVHFSDVVGEGYRTLKEGQVVEFAVEEDTRGPKARQVVVLAEPSGEVVD